MIERYALPEIADLFTDEARFGAWLEVEVLAVEAWAEARRGPGRRRRGGPRAGRLRRRGDPRARDSHRPRRRRVRRRRAGAHRRRPPARGSTTASRRATSSTPRSRWCWCRRCDLVIERGRRARGRRSPPGPTSYRDTPMVGRTHGIHAEPTTFGAKLALWALQVRRDRERLGAGPRRDRGRQALGRGRHVLQRRSRGRGATCASSSGSRPVPATQVLARDRHAEVLYACASVGATIESFALRDPPPAAHRGARGRGAVPRRRAEGLERDAAQAQPGEVRAALRARPRAARQPAGRRSRTSRCGTSATSRTRRSSASSSPTRCMLAYYVLGAVPRHRRGHARVSRADAARTSTRRTASCSASRCCSRWSRRA